MTDTIETPARNIYQRLNAARRKVDYIQKDATVSTGKDGKYKAVTHDQVVATTRDAFIENGVIVAPTLTACRMNDPLAETKQRLYEAEFDVSFINEDDPEDKHTMHVSAHAMDSGDKAPGKAMSYAVKVAILKLLMIETGESDESRYAGDGDAALLDVFLGQIAEAANIDVLKGIYAAAMEALTDKGDLEAIINCTSSRRKALADAKEAEATK